MALPQLGTLYNPNGDAIPGTLPGLWSQPGGPGTTVYPQPKDYAAGFNEPALISIAQYNWGCGHWSNLPAVFEQYDPVTQEQAAIICCPVCTYVQLIVVPYTLYQNYIQTPLVIA